MRPPHPLLDPDLPEQRNRAIRWAPLVGLADGATFGWRLIGGHDLDEIVGALTAALGQGIGMPFLPSHDVPIERLLDALAAAGVPPRTIAVEIVEPTLDDNPETALRIIEAGHH